MFGICNLAIIPLRFEPSDRSEIVSQILFGEHFEILEQQKQWSKVKMQYDDYEGWIDTKQLQPSLNLVLINYHPKIILNADLIEYITAPDNLLIPIPLGSSVSFLHHNDINSSNFNFEGTKTSGEKKSKESSIRLCICTLPLGVKLLWYRLLVLHKWFTNSMDFIC
jgi:hypothetical protein